MPVNPNREYRAAFEFRAAEDREYIVEGYATTFEPYELYEVDGVSYFERIMPDAFQNADVSDVIMQYDHEGMVFARTSNGTLILNTDSVGLHITADLSKTADARNLYEAIRAGMVTKMSFAFTVAEDSYDRDTCTRVIRQIKKVYDVSAVSLPANPDTMISARNYVNGVIEMEAAERQLAQEREKRIKLIKLLTEV